MNRISHIDIKPLAAHLAGIQPENDLKLNRIENSLLAKYDISIDQLIDIVSVLLPLIKVENNKKGFCQDEKWYIFVETAADKGIE